MFKHGIYEWLFAMQQGWHKILDFIELKRMLQLLKAFSTAVLEEEEEED